MPHAPMVRGAFAFMLAISMSKLQKGIVSGHESEGGVTASNGVPLQSRLRWNPFQAVVGL